MGTYTTNKNLFMPSVGETGWGELVNNNFSTIDTYLKPISLSGSTYTFTGNQTGGSISATSITNSGTLTQTGTSTFTGKITANGGIGTKALTTTSISNSGTLTQTGTSTFTGKITANGGIGTTSLTTSGNITSSGTISAPKIKQTGAMTITAGTPGNTGTGNISGSSMTPVCILPISTHKYTGSVKIKNNYGTAFYMGYFTEFGKAYTTTSIGAGATYTITLNNASVLYLSWNIGNHFDYLSIGSITLT